MKRLFTTNSLPHVSEQLTNLGSNFKEF